MNPSNSSVDRGEPLPLKRYLLSIGFGTWFFLAFNALVHLGITVDSHRDWKKLLMLCPYLVLSGEIEGYRLVTCAFVHGSASHLAMNLLALLTLGNYLEKALGTSTFICLTLISCFVVGPAYVLLSYIYTSLPFLNSQSQCVVGFSGVLFTFLFLTSSYGPSERRIFGMTLKSYYVPWIFLGISQLIAPNVSFLGHLAGILIGVMLRLRLLGAVMPSYHWVDAFEEWKGIRWVQNKTTWLPLTHESKIHEIMSCRFCGKNSSSTLLLVRYQQNQSSVEMPEI